MPSNLREYMSKNNVTNSNRDSQDYNRQIMEESQFGGKSKIQDSYVGDRSRPKKFMNSKSQCAEELTRILEELQKKDGELKRASDSHNSSLYKKFNEDYDNYAQQIIKQVQMHLKQNKERIFKQLRDRRATEMAQSKPIKRNIDKLKEEVTGLRDGLYRDGQYREYISKIVLKDYDNEMNVVQSDIDRLRFPSVDLRLDDKYYSCFKSDADKIIIVRDQMANRYGNQSYSYAPKSQVNSPYKPTNEKVSNDFQLQQSYKYEDLNPHANRDQIKRSTASKYK